ncbi:MAG: DUF1697 domain-containing protein [Phycicoccus sp.]|nr:DUF1697 domain-containing protein [Phycicoccus sp.]
MPTYISFLRAINVGGRFVKMADLRTGLSRQGFGDVESYIQSGNLRFTSSLRSAAKVELVLEAGLAELCGFTVRAIVRTPEHLAGVASYGSDLGADLELPPGGEVRRYVTFLKDEPGDGLVAMINGWDVVGERARVAGREVYLWLAHPSHEATLTNARIERGGVVATTRDWKVVTALGEMWGR